jgi:hypothetical protein
MLTQSIIIILGINSSPTGGEGCSVPRPGYPPSLSKKFHGYTGGMVPFENAGPFFLENWIFRILREKTDFGISRKSLTQ